MPDPSLKDVLDAIAKRDSKVAKLDSKMSDLRSDMMQRCDDLDAELTTHAKVHREIEKDITGLKGRPPRTAARAARRR
jgi:hypothetical protein